MQQGKGSKSRRVYVCQEGIDDLAEWLAIGEKDCQSDFLFMFDRKRRIHDDSRKTLMDTLKAAAGLRDHVNIFE